MICNKCGFANKGGGRVCSSCGALMDNLDINMKNVDLSGMELAMDEETTEVKPAAKANRAMCIVLAVVVVAGLGAAVYLPSYLVAQRAAQILEVISLARSEVEKHVREQGRWPITTEDTSFSMPAHSLGNTDVEIRLGVIELAISEKSGKIAKISPDIQKNRQIVWQCDNGGIGPEYLPPGCFK